MARARLHLICGNCGCSDDWSWKYLHNAIEDSEGNMKPDVFISCGNCSTLHSLANKAEEKND